MLPVSLLFSAFGTPVIRVLLEGGSFTAQDTILCGSIFTMYALGMAGFFMIDILNKAYYAMGKTLVPMCVTAGVVAFSFLSNALCSWLFPQQPFLLALGTSVGFLLGGSIMYMRFGRGKGVKMPVKQLVFGVLFSVLIYELVGPALTKRSLLAVGEIQPEGRVSARKLNDKHKKFHHLPVHVPHLPRKISFSHKKKKA